MRISGLLAVLIVSLMAVPASTQAPVDQLPSQAHHDDLRSQVRSLGAAAVSLPLATGLGALLAFRPRRRGTPDRVPAVVHTQIILAIVGAMVMLVVGQSLARAFGIVGAASLVRYRAKVEDPKDAGVMLTALGIGLAAGVGLHLLAAFATVFMLGVLWAVESFEPRATRRFLLKVTTKTPDRVKPRIEQVLRRHEAAFDLRTATGDEICYDIRLPLERRTEDVSDQLLTIEDLGVDWEEKKAP